VWGGVDRLRYHGILPIKGPPHPLLGQQRINFTFRKAECIRTAATPRYSGKWILSFTALFLIVLAAFIHASWNLLAKRAAHAGPAFVFYYSAISCLTYLPWAVWLVLDGRFTPGLAVFLCLVASGLLHLAYSLFLQRGYQVADLSVVYPIARGTGPMLSTIGAFLLLGETPSTYGVLGLIAIVSGIVLISTQGN